MPLTLVGPGNAGKWFTHSTDPETDRPVRARIRRVPPDLERKLTAKHRLNQVKKVGRNTQEVSVSRGAAFRTEKAAYALVALEMELRATEDTAESMSEAMGEAVAPGQVVDLGKKLPEAMKLYLLEDQVLFAEWVCKKSDELELHEQEAEGKGEDD
jgi:hypothetical protein